MVQDIRGRGLFFGLWQAMRTVAEIAVAHHYDAPWERASAPMHSSSPAPEAVQLFGQDRMAA